MGIIDVKVRVSYPEKSENGRNTGLELQVEDIGIPEKFIDILFTKYGKHGRKGTSGEKSIGLGLPILKSLVDAHRGNISVDSEEGEGTTFTVFLPELEG